MMSAAPNSAFSRPRGGFTLLEIMLVVALIAIVFIGVAPMLAPSLREQRLRRAAEDIADFVRLERRKAQEDGRKRVIEIHREGLAEADRIDGDSLPAPETAKVTLRLPGGDWEKPAGQNWEFSPSGLVTPWTVRLEEGPSWIEVDFDLLTGRVADERYVF